MLKHQRISEGKYYRTLQYDTKFSYTKSCHTKSSHSKSCHANFSIYISFVRLPGWSAEAAIYTEPHPPTLVSPEIHVTGSRELHFRSSRDDLTPFTDEQKGLSSSLWLVVAKKVWILDYNSLCMFQNCYNGKDIKCIIGILGNRSNDESDTKLNLCHSI